MVDVVPIFGGGVINIPELVFAGALPLTELTGAGGFEVSEQPANHSETSDKAAMRRTVNFGLPALIYPPGKNWLITSDIITVQGTLLNTGKDVHDTLTSCKITRKIPGIFLTL